LPDPNAARSAAEEEEARRAAEAARLAEEEAARRAEALRRAAEEDARKRAEEEEARRRAAAAAATQGQPPPPPPPTAPPPAAPATSKSLADQIKEEGFKSLMVHFTTSSNNLTDGTRAAVDKWVKEVWNDGRYSTVFNPNQLIVVGHCDETGAADVNQTLSENRAKSVADYLRSRHGINISNTKGLGQGQPISQNLPENRYVQVLLNSDDRRNAEFNATKVAVKGPLVH
jgi:outer membrane protein OmpA-like peptidoglycan-associated protein